MNFVFSRKENIPETVYDTNINDGGDATESQEHILQYNNSGCFVNMLYEDNIENKEASDSLLTT